MATWVVVNRVSGAVVYSYTAEEPCEWEGMSFATCNHIKQKKDQAAPTPARRGVTKQEFLDLLGPAAVAFILAAAKTNVTVEAWVKRLDLVTPEPDGTSVDLNDPRTIAGVEQLGQLMLSNGIVPTKWAEEVLSGNGL